MKCHSFPKIKQDIQASRQQVDTKAVSWIVCSSLSLCACVRMLSSEHCVVVSKNMHYIEFYYILIIFLTINGSRCYRLTYTLFIILNSNSTLDLD